ncbi:MAG: signal recognition particle protein Srp19 [Nitrososphaerota archaeon]|jgi:signal recognition particle subunit SRP19|uniref:signal recognition particle subunit SRP19/SEC65 family protein n=1 Tax=Candidatus Bathycorpusculum sp. TaxID=2994959 RepID=UPI00281D4464|nr:signal recognition particle protein Srp19 [Candidatus Termiticorpusculum sp.]MCL2256724.1 signal recognition particle protein Srp19 [Candidatus Termiticorpusculum sp.]MCL2292210.1 signal recognition particle protein Srp19 [Candidatus Termiticorpusculum sp.]MDR0459914.1 signal recognition particle protein Srp19 [Nitrososphaerota archaeon]
MRKSSNAIIWPVYFDVAKSKSEGRRVPKNRAVISPKILEIKTAADKLGIQNDIKPTAGYPKTPWIKMGMLTVKKNEPKEQIILRLATQLVDIKQQQQAEQQKQSQHYHYRK